MTEQKTEQRIIDGRLYDIIEEEWGTPPRIDQSGNIIVNELPRTEIVKIERLNIDSLSNWFDLKNYDFKGMDRMKIRSELDARRDLFRYLHLNDELDEEDRIDEDRIRRLTKNIFIGLIESSFIKKEKGYYHKTAIELIEYFSEDLIPVNLYLPDDIILEGVRQWLVKKRKVEERLSDAFFNNWICEDKIIAYIDLLLWKRITGNNLSDKKVSNLLFFDDPDRDAQFVRQTLRKNAKNLLKAEVNRI